MRTRHLILIIIFTIMHILGSRAKGITAKWIESNYTKTEVMIQMRDGIALYTAVYQPKDSSEKHPVIMQRTPYALRPYGKGFASILNGYLSLYVQHGYIIVLQNVRGTYLSEGEYENVRPIKKSETAIDEATDTYDTAEWILKNTYSNGAIGVKGNSYPGFYATWSALSGHPAIKAVSPQAPIGDWFMGDDVHHNGAFFLGDTYRFGGSFFRSRKKPTIRSPKALVEIDKPIYDYFLEKGAMQELMAPYGDSLKFWNEIKAHPDYDSFWKERSPLQHLKNIRPAVMVVAGTFDTDDCYGAFSTYKAIRDNSENTDKYIVIGPWAHGAWRDKEYSRLDKAYFGDGTAEYYLNNIEYPFFAYYLEGKGNKPDTGAEVLFSGDTSEDGAKEQWRHYEVWPPVGVKYEKYYLHNDKRISTKLPGKSAEFMSYISDPDNPVPYYHDTVANGMQRDYMAGDQSFLKGREDVLSFIAPAAKEEMMIAGPIKVKLSVSISTTDADFVVKLIDIRPDGCQMLVRGDVMPARYRKGFEKPLAMKPGRIEDITFTMPDVAHILKTGHRLMVQVQSSWYPLVAMNPQKLIDNQYYAKSEDYVESVVSIYSDVNKQSYVELPIFK